MNTDLLFESIEKYISLSSSEKSLIEEKVRERKLNKGQFLVYEGAVCRATAFVNKGSLRTYFIDLKGQEHIVQFAIEGWWISDFSSFIMQTPATLWVQAIEESSVLEFPYEDLEMLYGTVPALERYFRLITQRAYVSFQQRVVQNISMSAEDRYLAFQTKFPKLELRISQKLIASYLGISAEFMSKIKKRLLEKH